MKNTGLIGEVFALKLVTESSVLASISRRLRISTKGLNWCRKSEPKMGYSKSATVKTHVKSLRKTRNLTVRGNEGVIYRLQCDGQHWWLLSVEFQWLDTASCSSVNQTTCLRSGVCDKIGTTVT